MQVVIALIVTVAGFPLAREVMADNTTLEGFIAANEHQYGKAQRIWIMDSGIPTEAVLEKMRRNREMVAGLKTPDMRMRLVRAGAGPVGSSPPAFAGHIKAEIAKWAKGVATAGIRAK